MSKNNEEEKALVPTKKTGKRKIRKSIKIVLATIGLGIASIFGGNLYKEINQREIKEIEEIANDKGTLDEYNVKQEDIKKYLECQKSFKEIDKMTDEEVHTLLEETVKVELNILKGKTKEMFNNMSDNEKAKMAKEFQRTTDSNEIEKMYNIKDEEDIQFDLGVYGGEDHINIYNGKGEILFRCVENSYSHREKTNFGETLNKVASLQYCEENFIEYGDKNSNEHYDKKLKKEQLKEIEEAAKGSFKQTNKIIPKALILKDGKIEAVEPEKEDEKEDNGFKTGLKVDLGNGYKIVINEEQKEQNIAENTDNIQKIDDEREI